MNLLSPRLSLSFLIIIFSAINKPTSAQPSAASPTPPGPTNITAVLEKAGQFTTFIKLLKTTQQSDQINANLNNSNSGITIFAPTDNAFSNLKPGTLNSLTDQQKVQLVQFHILPSFLSTSQFQTVSNPLKTQAGNSKAGEFPMNVTTSGNQVNISTGVVDATVDNTIYTDNQLAVYQVNNVLLPSELFGAASPAPAPSKTADKGISGSPVKSSDGSSTEASGALGLNYHYGVIGVSMIGAVICFGL